MGTIWMSEIFYSDKNDQTRKYLGITVLINDGFFLLVVFIN